MLEAEDAACLGEGGLLLQEGDVVVVEERQYEEGEGEEAAAGGSRGVLASRTLALLQRIGLLFLF